MRMLTCFATFAVLAALEPPPLAMSTTPISLPTLPAETWLEIPAEHGLSYSDLKRVAASPRGSVPSRRSALSLLWKSLL